MKKITTFIISTFISFSIFSQLKLEAVELNAGINYSSFLFTNSDGERDQQYDFASRSNFGVNFILSKNKHIFRPSLNMRQGGAQTTLDNKSVNWKTNYVDVSVAYLYRVLNLERFSIAPGIGFYGGYMLNGYQNIGTTRYSLTDQEALNPIDFGLQGVSNFTLQVTESFTFGLDYRFGYGLAQIEEDEGQKTSNMYHSVLLGIGIKF